MVNQPSDLVADLADLVKEAQTQAEGISERPDAFQVIAFFDMTGSTHAKLTSGNVRTSRTAVTFTGLAAAIARRFGGSVIKTLGDGALATFPDALSACRAALNLRHAAVEILELQMTAGLTAGQPLRVALEGGQFDLLGDVVDRAARIQSLAVPGQVLMDDTLYSAIRGYVPEQHGWTIDAEPRMGFAKGIGEIRLYEITIASSWKPKKQLATPFSINASGRPSVSEKIALISHAHTEIIEIGIGLTSFALYFTGQKPSEFRDPIRALVRGGVNLKCFALDPTYQPGIAWVDEQGDPDYLHSAEVARQRIQQEGREQRNDSYLGKLTYHSYKRVPEFWCLGVDVDDPVDGRMFFTPYLMGVARSACPVIQVSRTSNPDLYKRFMLSIETVRDHSTERQ